MTFLLNNTFKLLAQIHIIVFFLITRTFASRKPLTGLSRMEIGEIRRFEFDSEYYKECTLNDAPFFVKKYFGWIFFGTIPMLIWKLY